MEEEVGFEPTVRVNVRQFSRLLQSTALALLHTVVGCILLYVINFSCQVGIKGTYIAVFTRYSQKTVIMSFRTCFGIFLFISP